MSKITNEVLYSEIKNISADVKEVKEHAKETNGRVSSLENEKWFTRGVMAVLTMLVLPILFIVIKMVLEK